MTKDSLEDRLRSVLNASDAEVEQKLRDQRNTETDRPVALGLQGNGALGAVAWGALDYLLEETALKFPAITAVGSGALNACALIEGWVTGGRDGARKKLRGLWELIGRTPEGAATPNAFLRLNPFFRAYQAAFEPIMSPYQLNPLDLNPMRDLVESYFDMDVLLGQTDFQLFLGLTNVASGRLRVFPLKEITIEALVASTANPYLSRAVEIDNQFYWDGTLVANPPLFPLRNLKEYKDYLLIVTTPSTRPEIPITTVDLRDRVSEIASNAAFERELRQFWFLSRMLKSGQLDQDAFFVPNIHMIGRDDLKYLNSIKHHNADPKLLSYFFEIGRDWAENWISSYASGLGVESTLDLETLFY